MKNKQLIKFKNHTHTIFQSQPESNNANKENTDTDLKDSKNSNASEPSKNPAKPAKSTTTTSDKKNKAKAPVDKKTKSLSNKPTDAQQKPSAQSKENNNIANKLKGFTDALKNQGWKKTQGKGGNIRFTKITKKYIYYLSGKDIQKLAEYLTQQKMISCKSKFLSLIYEAEAETLEINELNASLTIIDKQTKKMICSNRQIKIPVVDDAKKITALLSQISGKLTKEASKKINGDNKKAPADNTAKKDKDNSKSEDENKESENKKDQSHRLQEIRKKILGDNPTVENYMQLFAIEAKYPKMQSTY